MRRFYFPAFLILIFLGVFTSTALAQGAVAASDPAIGETAKSVFDAVMHGQWWAAAAYGVILALIGARKVMPASWKEGVKGDIIGTATVFVFSFAGAVGTWAFAQSAGAVMTGAVLLTALKIALAAIGGFTAIHKVVGWLAAWGKLPSWLVPLLKLLSSLVGSNAVAKAEAAGDKAVAADPPKGLTGDSKVIEVE